MSDPDQQYVARPCGECDGVGAYDDVATGWTVCHQCDGVGEMFYLAGDRVCPSTPS